MKFVICIAILNVLASTVSAKAYFQGPRSKSLRSDPYRGSGPAAVYAGQGTYSNTAGLDQDIEGMEPGILSSMEERPCVGLCYVLRLQRLAKELGLTNKDKRFDGYLYDFVK